MSTDPSCPIGCRVVPPSFDPISTRADLSRDLRIQRANILRAQPLPPSTPPLCNFEENDYQSSGTFIAMYSKGLQHDPTTGEVNHNAYCALLRGLEQNTVPGFDSLVGPYLGCTPVPSGGSMPTISSAEQLSLQTSAVNNQLRLVDPLAAQAFDLEGIDSHQLQLFDWGHLDANNDVQRIDFPKPPRFDSGDDISEIAENYWMALCRDVPFRNYATDPTTQAAARDLAGFSYSSGYPFPPKVDPTDPTTLFRGFTKGDRIGPYVSQFLVRPVPMGALTVDPRVRTVKPVRDPSGTAPTGKDYLTDFSSWLAVENGCKPATSDIFDVPRLLRSGRDMGQYVHVDVLFQEYFNACLILGTKADLTAPAPPCLTVPHDPSGGNLVGGGMSNATGYNLIQDGNPYNFLAGGSQVEDGFGTFGIPDIKTLVCEVAKRALKAAWYQKWSVHRRLRPEEFGGRIEVQRQGVKTYPFHRSFSLLSTVLGDIYAYNQQYFGNGTHLLPMAFPEGCPLHPAYSQGHATVAGACVTLLKAWFKDVNLQGAGVTLVQPSPDGTVLETYTGADASQMTVHGELNKLASNVGLARDFAGVHWRTDYTNGLRLGETVAIWFLCDMRNTYSEHFKFSFNTFDGHQVTIDNNLSGCFHVGTSPGIEAL